MQRRRFMQTGFAALAATGLPEVYNQYTYASRIGKRPSELRIVEIKRQTVKLPFGLLLNGPWIGKFLTGVIAKSFPSGVRRRRWYW